jgi:hypothetical protein
MPYCKLFIYISIFHFHFLLDALHKIKPDSKTNKKVDREIRAEMTQCFNVCSKKSKIWLRKYKSLKEKLKMEMDDE